MYICIYIHYISYSLCMYIPYSLCIYIYIPYSWVTGVTPWSHVARRLPIPLRNPRRSQQEQAPLAKEIWLEWLKLKFPENWDRTDLTIRKVAIYEQQNKFCNQKVGVTNKRRDLEPIATYRAAMMSYDGFGMVWSIIVFPISLDQSWSFRGYLISSIPNKGHLGVVNHPSRARMGL